MTQQITSPHTPRLRFPGFSGSWEEKKLGEVINEMRGGASLTPNDILNKGQVKILPKGAIQQGGHIILNQSDQRYCTQEYAQNNKTNIVDDSFIAIVLRDLVPSGPSIGLSVKVNDTYVLAQGVYGLKLKCSHDFFIHYTNSKKYRKLMKQLLVGSTQVHITNSELKKINFKLPSLPEQTKIASFLTAVDDKISNLTHLVSTRRSYKSGVMQQIFSQQIRFLDDNGQHFPDWEEKKLGEISKIKTGKLDANAMVENGEYRFYTCAKEYYHIDNYAFDTEALLVSGNGANVGYIHYYKGKFNAYQRTYVLDQFKENIHYIKYYLDQFLSSRIGLEKKEGNTPYIVLSTLSDMIIKLPSLPEQTKIANFLSQIDDTIAQLETQIEATKQWKKGLLQGLFI